jgi:hypothetical protein
MLSGLKPLSVMAIAASVVGATVGAQRCARRTKSRRPSVCPSAGLGPVLDARTRAKLIFGKNAGELTQFGIAGRIDRNPSHEAETPNKAERHVQALEDPVAAVPPPSAQNTIGAPAHPASAQVDDVLSRTPLHNQSADHRTTLPNADLQVGLLESYRGPSGQPRHALQTEAILAWDGLSTTPFGPLSDRSRKFLTTSYDR